MAKRKTKKEKVIDLKPKAEKITDNQLKEVQEVINEIEIGNKTTLKEYANDLWITAQVKSIAAKTVGLRVLSYNFETIKGKVYIAGISSRPKQLQEIVSAIETVKGVKEIVNYVTIKE